jgi:hypothetical protein
MPNLPRVTDRLSSKEQFMNRTQKLMISGTIILQCIVVAIMIGAYFASQPISPTERQIRLDAAVERLHAIGTEVDQLTEAVDTNGPSAEEVKQLNRLREEFDENRRELEDIVSGRTRRGFYQNLFLAMNFVNANITVLMLIFVRRLNRPIEMSVPAPSPEEPTYHSIEE